MGGTKIAAHLIDSSSNVLWKGKYPTAKGTELIAAINDVVDEAIFNINPDKRHLLGGIGIGIPGHVDSETGEIQLATNLDIIKPVPLGAYLTERYQVKVAVENDARAGAVGVQRYLHKDNVVFVNIGTGLAAGIVLNGKLYRGNNGMAGEIGHVAETYEDQTSSILENVVSGPGLIAQAKAVSCEISNPAEIFELAEAGDEAAERVLTRFFDHLTRALQWLTLTLDIEHVVLGGGVTKASQKFETRLYQSLAKLREQSTVTNFLLKDEKVEILPTTFNPGLWGATHLAQDMAILEK